TIADTREKQPEQASLWDLDGGGTISRTHRRNDDVTLPGEPERCRAKLDHRKVASFLGIKRNPVVHHNKRKWSLAGGTDHVGQHRDDRRDCPHFLADLEPGNIFFGLIGCGCSMGQQQNQGDKFQYALHEPPTTNRYLKHAQAALELAAADDRQYWQDMTLCCCQTMWLRSGIRSVTATINCTSRRRSVTGGGFT